MASFEICFAIFTVPDVSGFRAATSAAASVASSVDLPSCSKTTCTDPHLPAGCGHRDLDRRHGAGELFGFDDGNGGARESAGIPERETAADQDKQQQNE